ncbi:MAG: lysostaphin resistance A-like protein [Methyloligellaceae bacterium]
MVAVNEKISLLRTLLGSLVLIAGTLVVTGIVLIIYMKIQQHFLSYQEYEALALKPDFNGDFVTVAVITQFLVVVPLLMIVLRFNSTIDLIDFLKLTPPSGRDVALWLGVLVLLLILSTILSGIVGRPVIPEFLIAAYGSASSVLIFTVAIALCAPVWEELVFRGFLFSGLQSTILGTVGAAIITSALFAAIHTQYDLYIMVEIFIIGIVLCISRQQTGSLWVPVMLHSINNLIAVIAVANNAKL